MRRMTSLQIGLKLSNLCRYKEIRRQQSCHKKYALLRYNNLTLYLQKKLINWKNLNIEGDEDVDSQMPKEAKKKQRKSVKSKAKENLEKDKTDLMGMKEQDLQKLAENMDVNKNLPKEKIVQELTKVNAQFRIMKLKKMVKVFSFLKILFLFSYNVNLINALELSYYYHIIVLFCSYTLSCHRGN